MEKERASVKLEIALFVFTISRQKRKGEEGIGQRHTFASLLGNRADLTIQSQGRKRGRERKREGGRDRFTHRHYVPCTECLTAEDVEGRAGKRKEGRGKEKPHSLLNGSHDRSNDVRVGAQG